MHALSVLATKKMERELQIKDLLAKNNNVKSFMIEFWFKRDKNNKFTWVLSYYK